jgi:hypothetical protein
VGPLDQVVRRSLLSPHDALVAGWPLFSRGWLTSRRGFPALVRVSQAQGLGGVVSVLISTGQNQRITPMRSEKLRRATRSGSRLREPPRSDVVDRSMPKAGSSTRSSKGTSPS